MLGTSPLLFEAMTNHQVVPTMELNFTGAPPFACVNSPTNWDLKDGTKGKVLLSDITITKIVKVSPTMEEVTIEAALTTDRRRPHGELQAHRGKGDDSKVKAVAR